MIITGFTHAIINAVWLKLAFSPDLPWFEIVNELVSKPNAFFWMIVITYAFDLCAIILAFVILYGRSVSRRKKKAD